jgi:hypothetical protein
VGRKAVASNDYGTLRRHILALPFEVVIAGTLVVTFVNQAWLHVVISAFTLALCMLPLLLEMLFRVRLTMLAQTLFAAFIFSSMFAGEVFGMYGNVVQWDDAMHLISGVLIGLGALLWCETMVRRNDRIRMPSWLRLVFIFGVVASLTLLWEAAEFISDQFFGTFSQNGDLFDTMMDILYDMFGGLIVALLAALFYMEKQVPGLTAFIQHFRRINQDGDMLQ